jgi:hypothetical protein
MGRSKSLSTKTYSFRDIALANLEIKIKANMWHGDMYSVTDPESVIPSVPFKNGGSRRTLRSTSPSSSLPGK